MPASAFASDATHGTLQVAGGNVAASSASSIQIQTDAPDVDVVPAVAAPGQAALASVRSKSGGTVSVKVKKTEDVDGYEFAVARDAKFKVGVKRKISDKRSCTFACSSTPRKYYGKVRAYRLVGSTKLWGPWSSAKVVKTKKVKLAVVGPTTSGAGAWIKRCGARVVRVRSSKVDPANYDGLIIPGGGDVDPALYGQKRNSHDFGINRKLDKVQIALVLKFAKAGKPVLGVCRGAQVINVAYGGTLYQHIPGWHKGRRVAKVQKGSWLNALFGKTERVYHYHHQCVGILGDGLVATQWDVRDGHVEAIEHETLPVYGVQWHPEGMGARGRAVGRKFIWECVKAAAS